MRIPHQNNNIYAGNWRKLSQQDYGASVLNSIKLLPSHHTRLMEITITKWNTA